MNMLPIYYTGDWHHKNKKGLELLKNTRLWNGEHDGIIMVNHLDLSILENNQYVIFGPGVAFKEALDYFKTYQGDKTIFFNTLSPWNKKLYDTYAPNPKVTYLALPFPVDVERFKPTIKKKQFFIYIKHVEKERIEHIFNLLEQYASILSEYEFRTFTYGSYQEDDYLNYIRSAEFGIWVDAHESQGFALEEALSCNCPLFVYDISSMKDECMDDGTHPWAYVTEDLPATSASYFDETCGTICKNNESLHNMFASFLQVIPRFTPRKFVLHHLTATQFIDNIKKQFNL